MCVTLALCMSLEQAIESVWCQIYLCETSPHVPAHYIMALSSCIFVRYIVRMQCQYVHIVFL